MSASIRQELLLFFASVAQGCLLHILYDLLRGYRRAVPHGKKALAATDFLYWTLCGCLMFLFLFRANQGILRSYVLLGLTVGAALWNRTFSPLFVEIWRKLLGGPVFLVNFFRKRLLFFRERCKILGYQMFRWIKKGRNSHLIRKRGKRIGNSK